MLTSARPASQRNGIRQTQIPLAAQCGAQETKPTQRVGMNNGYYNEGRTWRCLVLNQVQEHEQNLIIFYRSNFRTKTPMQNFERLKKTTTCCLGKETLDNGKNTRPVFFITIT